MSAMPIAPWRFIDGSAQKVAYTATAGTSSAVGTMTRAILVAVTTDAHVRITPSGIAAVAATDMLIKAAYPPVVLGVSPGDKVSVIQDAAGGSLFMVELTH